MIIIIVVILLVVLYGCRTLLMLLRSALRIVRTRVRSHARILRLPLTEAGGIKMGVNGNNRKHGSDNRMKEIIHVFSLLYYLN
jgi:LSD1 subclass zinc finger protein